MCCIGVLFSKRGKLCLAATTSPVSQPGSLADRYFALSVVYVLCGITGVIAHASLALVRRRVDGGAASGCFC